MLIREVFYHEFEQLAHDADILRIIREPKHVGELDRDRLPFRYVA